MSHLEKSLEKVFFISRLLFIFPLKLDKNGFHLCPWMTICCMVHLLILLFGTIYSVFNYTINPYTTPMTEVLCVAQSFSMIFSLFISVISYLFSIDSLTDMLKCLKDIDALLYDYLTTFEIRHSFKRICLRGIFMLVLYVMDIVSFGDETFPTALLYWSFFLTQVMMHQFAGLMDIFLVRFVILNQRLGGLMQLKLPPLGILVRLTKICRRLSDCALLANGIYSVQFLSYFFTYFLNLAFICYYASDIPDIICYQYVCMGLVLCAWGFLLSFNMYTILSKTHGVTAESKEFNSRLYEAMLHDETGLVLNDKTLQLQINSNREVIFTAAGFFRLDLTLLVGIAGAVTSYCVTLIQISQRN